MSYSGAGTASAARENLGKALAALQGDPNIPPDVLNVAQNMAKAVGALFTAERAPDEPTGKQAVRDALGSLSQTLALLQDVRSQHAGIGTATEAIAKVMSALFPLTAVPSKAPPAAVNYAQPKIPQAAPVPHFAGMPAAQPAPIPQQPASVAPKASYRPSAAPVAPRNDLPRVELEANIGATTESNFFVGFSGEVSEGGVFIATYTALERGQRVLVTVTLPGGFETKVDGLVRFVRDPLDFSADSEPGVGVQFAGALTNETRELVLRFIRKRAPMFYDE
jgi:uncharacterized protein (TIGR02266 family)